MGMSESHDSEAVDATHKGRDATERVTLASLRSQFTTADTSTLDEAMGTRARFREGTNAGRPPSGTSPSSTSDHRTGERPEGQHRQGPRNPTRTHPWTRLKTSCGERWKPNWKPWNVTPWQPKRLASATNWTCDWNAKSNPSRNATMLSSISAWKSVKRRSRPPLKPNSTGSTTVVSPSKRNGCVWNTTRPSNSVSGTSSPTSKRRWSAAL